MSNPFLTKKDPILESVKTAMQDGEYRRQAEAQVNEQFGVYSRKAVIREQLAAYDAALEEAYTNLKEGKKLADKDYDQDGERETPKDEVWGSRLRAARLAGKLKEEEQIDEISKELAGRYAKKAHSQSRNATARAVDAYHNNLPKTQAHYSDKSNKREAGMRLAIDKLSGRAKVSANEETDYSAERGEKVAGAILKKIRAKHMKEDSSFNAAHLGGKSVKEQVVSSDNIFNASVRKPSAINLKAGEAAKRAAQARSDANRSSSAPVVASPATPSVKGSVSAAPLPPRRPAEYSTPATASATTPSTGSSATTTTPATSTQTTTAAAAKPAPAPVKTVQTKGGAFPVFSKTSDAASEFRKAYSAATPGSTFKWKATGETGPEREYKAAPASSKSDAPSTTPAAASAPSTGTTSGSASGSDVKPTGDTTTTDTSAANRDPNYGRQKKDAGTTPQQTVAESYVNVGSNKYRIV